MSVPIALPPLPNINDSFFIRGVSQRLPARVNRLVTANMLIYCIATNGHNYFLKRGNLSYIEIDQLGKLWWVDGRSRQKFFLHVPDLPIDFPEGATLKALIIAMRKYIMTGELIPSRLLDGDLLGYGDDMDTVRYVAKLLGMYKSEGEA